jgi:hypothetical protein
VTIDGVSIGWLDLLTSYTINSYLQAIQRYRWCTQLTVHRYTRTRILSLHWSYPDNGIKTVSLWLNLLIKSQSHITTDGQSVSKSWCWAPSGLMTRYLLLFDSYGLVFVERPLWQEDRSVFYICCWPLPVQSFSGPSPSVLATIFYCLRFETSLFVASYDSQGHGAGVQPRLHTGTPSSNHTLSLSYMVAARTTQCRKHSSTMVV